MNYRLNTQAIVIAAIFIILAIALFIFTINKARTGDEKVATDEITETGPADTAPGSARIITAKHDFEDGMHTIAGTVDVPTPCDRLEAEPFFVEGDKTNVEIRFKTINQSAEDEACAQVITPARFKVEYEAPEEAVASATLNDESVVLNLIEVPEGEDLDSFSEFIKG